MTKLTIGWGTSNTSYLYCLHKEMSILHMLSIGTHLHKTRPIKTIQKSKQLRCWKFWINEEFSTRLLSCQCKHHNMYLLWLDNNRLGGERAKRTILVLHFIFWLLHTSILRISASALAFSWFSHAWIFASSRLYLLHKPHINESAFGKQPFHDGTILGLWALSYINASISFLKHASSYYM